MSVDNLLVVLAGVAAFWVYCLVDFNRTDDRDIQVFDRHVWVLLLVCFDVVAGVMWLTFGRRRPAGR